MMSRQESLGFSTLSPWGECWNSGAPPVSTPLLGLTDFNKHFPFFSVLSDIESDMSAGGVFQRSFSPTAAHPE